MSAWIHASADRTAHIGRIVLRRPAQRNALSTEMARELVEALSMLERDDAIKIILISAEGSDLSAGFDASQAESLYKNAPGGNARKVPSQRARLLAQDSTWWGPQGLYGRLLHCPKITVLAAKGLCLEAGLYLALYCDLVIAADDARFANPKWRHVGVDGDISMLVAAVGLKRANEMMFCGAEWTAAQALDYGLVDQVVGADELTRAVETMAALCAQVMRDGIVAEKHVVFASLAKMQVGMGMAMASVMAAYGSNLHFRDGEFNFLREARERGVDGALAAATAHFRNFQE